VARAFADVVSKSFSTRCERVRVTYEDAALFCTREESCEREGVGKGQRLAVHFGLRGSGTDVAIERYAHNCRGETRDESGEGDWSDVVAPGGPIALETLLPVRALASSLDDVLDCDARVSRDVGEYVCNAIYYHSLRAVSAARRADCAAEALFVHVPPLEPEAAACAGAGFGEILGAHLSARLDQM
jgi:pyroglutamyl-peptidase